MRHKARRIKHGGLSRHIFGKDKLETTQTIYGGILMIALFAAAIFVDGMPVVSFISVAVMFFCLVKGGLWQIEEEKEKSLPKNRTGENNNSLTHR